MTPDQYKERLREIGRLAARLDGDQGHPLDVLIDFFDIDEKDQIVVREAYDKS